MRVITNRPAAKWESVAARLYFEINGISIDNIVTLKRTHVTNPLMLVELCSMNVFRVLVGNQLATSVQEPLCLGS